MSSIKTKKQTEIKKTAQFYYKLKISILLSGDNAFADSVSDKMLEKLFLSETFFSEKSVN